MAEKSVNGHRIGPSWQKNTVCAGPSHRITYNARDCQSCPMMGTETCRRGVSVTRGGVSDEGPSGRHSNGLAQALINRM